MLDLSVLIDEVRPSPDEQSCHCSVKQDGQLKRQRQTITYAPGGCCSPQRRALWQSSWREGVSPQGIRRGPRPFYPNGLEGSINMSQRQVCDNLHTFRNDQGVPLGNWSDVEERKTEVRVSIERLL